MSSSPSIQHLHFSNLSDGNYVNVQIALLFANFGLYHLARLNALRKEHCVLPIEFACEQKLYGWKIKKDSAGIKTLHPAALEDMSFADLASSCATLWRILNKHRPSHLFIPGYADIRCLVAALWARAHSARSVLMFDSTERDKPRTYVKELAKGLVVRFLFSEAFVGGRSSTDYLRKLGIPNKKIVTKYDVVDNELFRQGTAFFCTNSCASEWNLPSGYFLFVGRLAPEKNCGRLLSAFKKYKSAGGNWDLVIVGRGPLQKELLALRSSLNLDTSIHFAGFKNAEDLLPYYAFANCFVLPSTSEPWGLVVNEAMASGLPLLVSRVCGCVPDLVREGYNGYSFDPYNPNELTHLLQKMSFMSMSERAAMGGASQEIIAQYTPEEWANSARQLLDVGV